jgi:hypothetical protein
MAMRDRRDSGDEFWDNLSKQIDDDDSQPHSGATVPAPASLDTVAEVVLSVKIKMSISSEPPLGVCLQA